MFDAFIISVGTPLYPNSTKPNLEAISAAVKSLQPAYDGSQVVIIRSTVSVGTTRKTVLPLLSKLIGKREEELFVSMCPERTIEGKALQELKTLPQIISGNNQKAADMARRVFEKISPRVIEAKSLEEAELAKLYCNTYRDINFSVGNAFCLAAQMFGVDGMSVINLANEGYSRSKISRPGFVAGPCLEKDAYILTDNMPDCASKNLILGARKISESLEDLVVEWVKRHVGAATKPLVLSGMAFKGRPETSDLRGSSAVNTARKLFAAGYSLRLHDFVASVKDLEALQLGEAFEDLPAACKNAAALLVLNNHEQYENFLLPESSLPVFDSWQVCKKIDSAFTLGNILLEEGK
ncbi:MAG: nucleotide sugar dehydrogenase [Selenomonadaceae bacterium]|nr:nucleotide sugar dehydrogenase [Selenomonadaceae bacterium]MBQ3726641.1 nucleotide sugar dehydrogenase [Selenomonadaceae bacterium]